MQLSVSGKLLARARIGNLCPGCNKPQPSVSSRTGLLRSKTRKSSAVKASLIDTLQHAAASAPHLVQHTSAALYQLADAAALQAASDVATTTAQVIDAASTVDAAQAAQQAASSGGGGPFGFLAEGFEAFLKVLDGGLERAGVPYSYGFSIILLTLMVKAATFPLTKKQVESTLSMQALSPRLKEIQAKYANDQETLQMETAKLYRDAGVNPLAGCLPTLATIPVFIGLYQALTKAANDGLLTDGFFWIPSLGGPVTALAQKSGAGVTWLFPFIDGHPPLGWAPTAAYLVLPVLLVVSQYVSQKIISSSNSQDPSQAQAQAILKFLPLMIGWFSLNVPSGLTLYWLINNVLSTAQQIYLKSSMKPLGASATSASASTVTINTTLVKPKEERVKKVTGKDLGARKKKREDDGDAEVVEAEVMDMPSSQSQSRRGEDNRGSKFRATKAKEAAGKAATQAEPSRNGASGGDRFSALKEKETQGTVTAQAQPELKVDAPDVPTLVLWQVPDAPPAKDNASK